MGILLLLLYIPLYAHDGERHDRTQDGHGLHVEDELTQEPAERPREREERRTLKNNMDALTHSAGWLVDRHGGSIPPNKIIVAFGVITDNRERFNLQTHHGHTHTHTTVSQPGTKSQQLKGTEQLISEISALDYCHICHQCYSRFCEMLYQMFDF